MRRGSLTDQAITFCCAVPATGALILIAKAIIVPALRGLRILLGGG